MYACLLLLRVSVTWLACVPVSSYMCVRTSLCVSVRRCVGLLRSGFLPDERTRAVRVRTGSQHPLLQAEVPGVSQVCGTALPPRC